MGNRSTPRKSWSQLTFVPEEDPSNISGLFKLSNRRIMAFLALLLKLIIPPIVTALSYGLYCTYQHRRRINELRKQGVVSARIWILTLSCPSLTDPKAMPKWNWFLGHLLVLGEYIEKLPPDANVQMAMQQLALTEFAHTEVFLMDTWPMYPAFWVVFDPQAAYQVSNKFNLPKLPLHLKFMMPVVGGPSMHGMNHAEWKYWRSIFNPGFSGGSMMDLVPAVVDSVQVFCDILKQKAGSKEPVQLSKLTNRLTMEVILKVTL